MPLPKNPNMGRPVINKHKVPAKMWDQWSNFAKKVYNAMMEDMRPRLQFAYLHPDTPPMPRQQWDTTRRNAAWSAAQIVNGAPPLGGVIENGKIRKGARKAKRASSSRGKVLKV